MSILEKQKKLTRKEIIETQLGFSLGALPIEGFDLRAISAKIANEIEGTLKRFEMGRS